LIETIDTEYDVQAGVRPMNIGRYLLTCMENTLYGKLAILMTGHGIEDLTSAVNAARAMHYRKFTCLRKIRFYYPMPPRYDILLL